MSVFGGARRILVMIPLAAFAFAGAATADDDDAVHAAAVFDFEHVSCKGNPREIRIVVDNVEKSIGRVTADLYPNEQDGFLRGKGRIAKLKFAARAPQTKFCITVPEDGEYALAVYHDRNANNTFDKSAFGMPAEPWGLSMNPKVRFGPPPVEKTAFPVTENGATVKINLR